MKTLLMFVAVLMLTAAAAPAIVDATPNMVGIYFDMNADNYCKAAAPYSTIPVYIILTSPTMETLAGYELGAEIIGSAMVLSITIPNFVPDSNCLLGNLLVHFLEPLPCTEATLLTELRILYMDTTMGGVSFDLHGGTPSSLDPALPTLLLTDGTPLSATLPPWDWEYGCAWINTLCPTPVDDVSWDGVKSLYR